MRVQRGCSTANTWRHAWTTASLRVISRLNNLIISTCVPSHFCCIRENNQKAKAKKLDPPSPFISQTWLIVEYLNAAKQNNISSKGCGHCQVQRARSEKKSTESKRLQGAGSAEFENRS
jgi:hypothetical protein